MFHNDNTQFPPSPTHPDVSLHSDPVPDLETATVVFALIGKFGAGGVFSIVFVYGAELFPTDVRNTGIGMSSAAGRIGSILAPFIAGLVSFFFPSVFS